MVNDIRNDLFKKGFKIQDYYYQRKFEKLRMAIAEVVRIRHKLIYYPKREYSYKYSNTLTANY